MSRYDKGWLKLWRLPDDHWLQKDPSARFLWWELLTMATFKQTKVSRDGSFIDIPPGTVITSRRELSARIALGEMVVRDRLALFEKDEMITHKKSQRGSIVTINNWDKYQGSDEVEIPQDIQPASHSHPTDNPLSSHSHPSKEEAKKLRIKKIPPYTPPPGEGQTDPIEPKIEQKPAAKKPTPSDLAQVWNDNCGTLKKLKILTLRGQTAAKARKRLEEEPDLGVWAEVVKQIANWPFGRGKNDRSWEATFTYLLRVETITKFHSGFWEPSKGNGRKMTVEEMFSPDLIAKYAHLEKQNQEEVSQ